MLSSGARIASPPLVLCNQMTLILAPSHRLVTQKVSFLFVRSAVVAVRLDSFLFSEGTNATVGSSLFACNSHLDFGEAPTPTTLTVERGKFEVMK